MRHFTMRHTQLMVLGLLLLALPAFAQDASSAETAWRYDVAPYFLWAMAIDGEVAIKGMPSQVDVSFGDVIDDLDFMFDAHFEARHENGWGILVEPTFIILESAGEAPGGDVLVENTIVMFEGMVTKGFGQSDRGLALIFGARYMNIEVEIEPALPPTIEQDKSWTDAVVGLLYQPVLSDRWSLSLRGDVGAGGSDLAWNATALAFVDLTRHSKLVFGYRHMDIDYEDGSGSDLFGFDASLSGPIIGFDFSF